MSTVMAPANTNNDLDPKLKAAAKQVFRVRLLRGRHADREGKWDPEDENKSFAPGTPERKGRNSVRTFQANRNRGVFPEFETVTDLTVAAYNPKGYPPRFEIVSAPSVVEIDPMVRRPGEALSAFIARVNDIAAQVKGTVEQTLKSLDTMTLEQLRDVAETEEVEYEECRTADDFRKAIRSRLAPPPPPAPTPSGKK